MSLRNAKTGFAYRHNCEGDHQMDNKWDKPRVIDQLRARYGSGRPIYVWRGDFTLYAAATRQFGS